MLLELQQTHRVDRPEVMVGARHAHPALVRETLDAQRPVEVLPQPLAGLGDAAYKQSGLLLYGEAYLLVGGRGNVR